MSRPGNEKKIKITELINLTPKMHHMKFRDLNKNFVFHFKKFAPLKKCQSIKKYFGPGVGLVGSLKLLSQDNLIVGKNDFQGIYVFSKNAFPFYVGISQHVIERIKQHVKGTNHFSSSLCYRFGADHHVKVEGAAHAGGRAGLDFTKYVLPARQELMACDVSFYPIEDCLELYLFEVFVAMELETLNYNLFQTH